MNSINTMIINTEHLLLNALNLKHLTKVKLCAVVKADGYSHGTQAVVKTLKKVVDFFAVADCFEAEQVRLATSKPILILCPVEKCEMELCLKNRFVLSVGTLKNLIEIEKTAKRLRTKAKVHLKVNTGMNRLGFKSLEKFKKVVDYILASKHLILDGVYTHFFDACQQEIFLKQKNKFEQFALLCPKTTIKHASATNAVLLTNSCHYDMIRPGLLLYGYSDAFCPFRSLPVMEITSKIVNIISIKKGEFVGYGQNFIAPKNMKIAVVGMGYADGFLRANSNNARVIVNNQYLNIVGTICMDLFMVDATNKKCKIGDEVVILGKRQNKQITAEDIAKNTGTITYEVLTNFKLNRMKKKTL